MPALAVMKAMKALISLIKSNALLGVLLLMTQLVSGCAMYATRGLLQLGKNGHRISVQHLEAAYAYRDEIVLGYTANARRESEHGKGEVIACWATAPISVIRDYPKTGLLVSYRVRRGEIPKAIVANAQPVPVVSRKPSARPPEFDPNAYNSRMVVFDDGLAYYLGMVTEDEGVKVIGVNYPSGYEEAFWIYPLMFLGMPVTIVFDVVTSPIQGAIAKERHDAPWPF
jgi:hypothetical protein